MFITTKIENTRPCVTKLQTRSVVWFQRQYSLEAKKIRAVVAVLLKISFNGIEICHSMSLK